MIVYEAKTLGHGSIKYESKKYPFDSFSAEVDNKFGDHDYRNIKSKSDPNFGEKAKKAENMSEFISEVENTQANDKHFFLDGVLFYRLEKGLFIERKTTEPIDHLKTEFGHADEEAVIDYEDKVIDMRDELKED